MEWINFVEENPQYLTVNYPSKSETPAIILSISKGLTNVKETLAPIDILRDKLSRSEIIKYQKIELSEPYTLCLVSDNAEFDS